MADNFTDVTPSVVEIVPNRSEVQSKIGTDEFKAELLKEFTGKHRWRSSVSLAKSLKVDAKDLEKFLDKNPDYQYRVDDQGIVFYAVYQQVKRVEKTVVKNTISAKERYALAMLYHLSLGLEATLDKYALIISERDIEILSHLTRSLTNIKSGTALFACALKADITDLTKN